MSDGPGQESVAEDVAPGSASSGSAVDEAEVDEAAHHRRRIRTPLRITLVGGGLGVAAAALTGTQTQDGRAAFAVLLLVLTSTTALAGVHMALLLVLDDVRGRPTRLTRGFGAFGWLVVTALLMAALSGIGG